MKQLPSEYYKYDIPKQIFEFIPLNNINSSYKDWKLIDEGIAIGAGLFFLLLFTLTTIVVLLKDIGVPLKICVYEGERRIKFYWPDTISLHCSSGCNKYLLSIICGYCAIYLATMKSIEFKSHKSSVWNTVILFVNFISYLFLLLLGVLETHPHPNDLGSKIRSYLHIIAAGIFLFLNVLANLFWTFECIRKETMNAKNASFLIHRILSISSVILFVFLLMNSIVINLWFFSSKSPITSFERWNTKSGWRGFIARLIVIPKDDIPNPEWCAASSESNCGGLAAISTDSQRGSSPSCICCSIVIVKPDPSGEQQEGTPERKGKFCSVEPKESLEASERTEAAKIKCSNPSYGSCSSSSSCSTTNVLVQAGNTYSHKHCRCLIRRKIFRVCVINYILELCLIVNTVIATLLQISIEIPSLPWAIKDSDSIQDLCWEGKNITIFDKGYSH